MLQDFWALVQGEKNEGVSKDTLKVALLNCIGIKTADREMDFHIEESHNNSNSNSEEAAEPVKDDIDKLGHFDDNLRFYLKKGAH